MKKLWTVVLVFLALMIWQIAMPYYTVYQIRQAVEQKDVRKLAHYVDFDILKQNLKSQLHNKLRQSAELQSGSFFGTLALSVTEQTLSQMLDKTVNPQSILLYIEGKQLFDEEYKQIAQWTGTTETATQTMSTAQVKSSVSNNKNWQAHFDDMSQFSVVQQRPSGMQIRYILTRSGLGWKLTNIILPDFSYSAPE